MSEEGLNYFGWLKMVFCLARWTIKAGISSIWPFRIQTLKAYSSWSVSKQMWIPESRTLPSWHHYTLLFRPALKLLCAIWYVVQIFKFWWGERDPFFFCLWDNFWRKKINSKQSNSFLKVNNYCRLDRRAETFLQWPRISNACWPGPSM